MAKRVTLKTIAKRAGLSVPTACLALSGHKRVSKNTQERVRAISDALGYSRGCDREMTANGQRTYGLVLLGTGHSTKSGSGIVTFLSHVASTMNRRMEIISIQDISDKEKVKSRLAECSKELTGLFLTEMVDVDIVNFMASKKTPCIVLGDVIGQSFIRSQPGEEVTDIKVNQVTHDTIGMGWAATSHLLEKGLSPVAFIAYEGSKGLYQDRWLTGYRNALFESGQEVDRNLIYMIKDKGFDAKKIAKELTDLPKRPRSFVLPDPELALPFLLAMERLNRPVLPNSLVLGGTRERIVQCGLDGSFSIEPDIETWSKSAFTHMEMIVNGYVSWPETVTCPFLFHAPDRS